VGLGGKKEVPSQDYKGRRLIVTLQRRRIEFLIKVSRAEGQGEYVGVFTVCLVIST